MCLKLGSLIRVATFAFKQLEKIILFALLPSTGTVRCFREKKESFLSALPASGMDINSLMLLVFFVLNFIQEIKWIALKGFLFSLAYLFMFL